MGTLIIGLLKFCQLQILILTIWGNFTLTEERKEEGHFYFNDPIAKYLETMPGTELYAEYIYYFISFSEYASHTVGITIITVLQIRKLRYGQGN